MADVTKAEWQALNDRVRAMENDMAFVRGAKVLLSLCGVALIGAVCSFFYNAGAYTAQIKSQGERIDKLEAAQAAFLQTLLSHVKVSTVVYEGTVVRADAAGLVVHLAPPDDKDQAFKFTAATAVTIAGQKAAPQDLKAGMSVHVTPDEAGGAAAVVSP